MAGTFAEAFKKAGIDIPKYEPSTTEEISKILIATLKSELENNLANGIRVYIEGNAKGDLRIVLVRSDTDRWTMLFANCVFDICYGKLSLGDVVNQTLASYKKDILRRYFKWRQ